MPQPPTPRKVAIVCDWLVGGGAELVVEQLHQLFPDAPIFTSYATREWRRRLDGKVRTGWLQPFGRLRKYLPVFRIWWFTHLRFKGYDLVLSSSGAEAKGIKVPAGTIHINYCHAPTHYYWGRYEEYLAHPGFGMFDWLARLGLRLFVGPLRRWDRKAAGRPRVMVANSTHTQAEIKRYYGRDSRVVYPPVNLERFMTAGQTAEQHRGFVVSGRQTPYKRFDLAVVACSKLDLPLTVIGDGPDHRRLRRLADSNVTFLGRVSDEVLAEEFAQAEALIFPGLDDFGITAVEAMAAGTPVIAYQGGGALDYVVPGETGVFFKPQTATALARALKQFEPHRYKTAAIMNRSRLYSPATFRKGMLAVIKASLI